MSRALSSLGGEARMACSFVVSLAAGALITAACTHDPFRGHHYQAPPPAAGVVSPLAPLKLHTKPLIRTFRLPTTDFPVYQTFALVPSARVGMKTELNEFEE